MSKTSKRYAIAIAVLLTCAVIQVGTMDYEDAVASDTYYCGMVREGYWPAYNERIDCEVVE